ncbi:RecX family transcriptional regulator [Cetobacterium sp. 8H]|uniref:regulatory protein RecX n=1 Tax=Cetobacterium sp. 8H TaxID=2759681 RepID=UPI00163C01BE|nr:RecX family transcriptional regulator [Cetobacterium sp. 8H]MBC2850687.1 RecX family transcriptional regulator [Cetobacterium sp. 8H]
MKLKRLLKNKYLFENGLNIGLSNEIISEYDLKRREELSQEEYLRVLELAALSTSYFYLAKRDYSKKEIYNKLLQKYWEKIPVQKVILILEAKGLLDDLEFAKNYVKNKKGGRKKIEYDLRLKGISSSVLKEALESYENEDELSELRKAWDKLGSRDEQKKIASLMRKGYSYGDIKKILVEKQEEEC